MTDRHTSDDKGIGLAQTTIARDRKNNMRLYVIILSCLVYGCSMRNGIVSPDPGLPIACDSDPTLCCTSGSPIIVDLAGDGIHLSGPGQGVLFALEGTKETWSWTLPGTDDAWLVLDRDGNGAIDDGTEMFGDMTPQPEGPSPNGFNALTVFDDNGDYAISPDDAIWSRLRLWRDVDGDGISAPRELLALDDVGIHSISTTATPSSFKDLYGNQFRFVSKIVADYPVSTVVSDVWLQHEMPRGPVAQDYTQWTCYAWGYAVALGTAGNPSIYTGPCGNTYTASDPYVTDGFGQLAKLVIRSATSTDKNTAFNRAYDITANAIFGQMDLSNACQFSYPPNPDLAESMPWDKPSSAYSPGVKCVSQIISTTQGGGGGGC